MLAFWVAARFTDPIVSLQPYQFARDTTLKRAGVSYFPIYNLRHTFYRRLSWVAPECRRAARNAAQQLGNKTDLQLGLVHQVREQLERVNEKSYEGTEPLQFRDNAARTKNN